MKRKTFIGLLIVLVVIFGGRTVGAETTGPAKSSTDYHLRPGDLLTVVIENPRLAGIRDLQDILITKDGTAQLAAPNKPIKVAGLTLAEATKILVAAIADQKVVVKPSITVSIKSYAPRRANILGLVLYPGYLEIHPPEPMTVVKAINQTGGLTPKASNNLTLTRRLPDGNTTTRSVNFLDAELDPSKNLALQDGDTLTAL